MRTIAADRHSVRRSARLDRLTGGAGRCAAERGDENGGGEGLQAAAWAGCPASGAVAGAAGVRGPVLTQPLQTANHRPDVGNEEPVYRPYQSAGRGLLAETGRGALPDYRRTFSCAAGSREGRHQQLYADGSRQEQLERPGGGKAGPGDRVILYQDQPGILRLGGDTTGDGARHPPTGYVRFATGGGSEPGICEKTVRSRREPDRTLLRAAEFYQRL